METTVVTLLFCIVGMLFSILLVLSVIAKMLKNSSESLSKIAKHFGQIDEKDKD